ncbi:MAG: hypothetical protein KAR05_05725 [Candidatus Omnitrophica bacterium]|nr:hypothetical protein [Candidatus Omnitrophota bacterium]
MNAMIIIMGVGIFVVLLWLLVFSLARKMQKQRSQEFMRKFKGQKVLGASSNADFFG